MLGALDTVARHGCNLMDLCASLSHAYHSCAAKIAHLEVLEASEVPHLNFPLTQTLIGQGLPIRPSQNVDGVAILSI